jgi:hypothetical protein
MRQKLLEEYQEVLNDRFFQRLEGNLLPKIRATSTSKPYRPFADFLKTLRRMFAIAETDDGDLGFRYGSQIDDFWWRSTSKKELAKRSKLTIHQVRTCLRIAVDHELIERRIRRKGTCNGSEILIRLNFPKLRSMLGPREDPHIIKARKKSRRNAEALQRLQKASDSRVSDRAETAHSDEGNFTRQFIGINNITEGRELEIKQKVRNHSPDGELFLPNQTEEEGEVSTESEYSQCERSDLDLHADGSVRIVLENGKIKLLEEEGEWKNQAVGRGRRMDVTVSGQTPRPLPSGEASNVFEITNDELGIIDFLQNGENDEVPRFPSEGDVNRRVPVEWDESLLKLFLRRVRQDGLDLEFFRRLHRHYSVTETPHICLVPFRKLLEIFPKFSNYFSNESEADSDAESELNFARQTISSLESDYRVQHDLDTCMNILLQSGAKKGFPYLMRQLVDDRSFAEERFRFLRAFWSREGDYWEFGLLLIMWGVWKCLGSSVWMEDLFEEFRPSLAENLYFRNEFLLRICTEFPGFAERVFDDDLIFELVVDEAISYIKKCKKLVELHGMLD